MISKFTKSPLLRIIVLASVLAIGFLLVMLSSAFNRNKWLPIFTSFIALLAHLPIFVCNRWSSDDFMSENATNIVDLGRYLSAFLIVTMWGLPLISYHSAILSFFPFVFTLLGNTLIYGSVLIFNYFFTHTEEDEFDI